ncbi:MAG: hypothetical protein AB1916_15430 [Thermodesulfobacteriota bacterium]
MAKELSEMPLEEQFDLYISVYGSPTYSTMFGASYIMAMRGEGILPYLKEKLSIEHDPFRIMAICAIFERMAEICIPVDEHHDIIEIIGNKRQYLKLNIHKKYLNDVLGAIKEVRYIEHCNNIKRDWQGKISH